MRAKNLRKEPARIEEVDLKNIGVIAWDTDNLYPLRVKNLCYASSDAKICLSRYKKFIAGDHISNVTIRDLIINEDGETVEDIKGLIAGDVGESGGFALHIGYNALGLPNSIKHIPFDWCRLSIDESCFEDDEIEDMPVTHIAVLEDWSGKKTKNGKTIKVSKENIKYFPVFNPEKAKEEISEIGIDDYTGQVYWCSMGGKWTYPIATYDAVLTQIATDISIGNVMYRNAAFSFTPGGLLIFKKGQVGGTGTNEGDEHDKSIYGDSDMDKVVNEWQTDENTGKLVLMDLEYGEEMPEFIDVAGKNYDKEYTISIEYVAEKIYSAFSQMGWYRMLKGGLGFSQDIMRDCYEYLNTETFGERKFVEVNLSKVLNTFGVNDKIVIEPLKYVTIENNQS